MSVGSSSRSMVVTRMPHFRYMEADTVAQACSLLKQHGEGAKLIAGGTDLVVSMRKQELKPRQVISIKDITDLHYIKFDDKSGLRIGALVTHSQIARSEVIRSKYEALAAACGKVGTPQVRNVGTIGGNLCQAGPSQDTPPAVLALGASIKVVGPGGERLIPASEFFLGPFKTCLGSEEILTEIQFPPVSPRSASTFKWATKITAVDETLVGVAVLMSAGSRREVCGEIRIGLCSVAPTPIRARAAERVLTGKVVDAALIAEAAAAAVTETRPRSQADYRRHLTGVLVGEAIGETWHTING